MLEDPNRGADSEVKESLKEEATHIIEECRMVLPGIQALFGFQLIAIFNARFAEALTHPAQTLHLMALFFVATSLALIMAPAAYHRQVERGRLSRFLCDYGSVMMTLSMLPLTGALSIDVGIVALVVLKSAALSISAGILLGLFLAGLWFVFPMWMRSRHRAR